MAAVLVGPVAAALLRLLQDHYATHQCSFLFSRSSREEHTSGAAAAVSLTSAAAALLRVTAGAAAEHLEGPEVRPATWAGPGKPKAPRHRACLQPPMANQYSILSRTLHSFGRVCLVRRSYAWQSQGMPCDSRSCCRCCCLNHQRQYLKMFPRRSVNPDGIAPSQLHQASGRILFDTAMMIQNAVLMAATQ